ncbi:MAG: hypothetical protein ACFFEF_08920 [Candidatus Thorarchaeota archaeon]
MPRETDITGRMGYEPGVRKTDGDSQQVAIAPSQDPTPPTCRRHPLRDALRRRHRIRGAVSCGSALP